MNRFIIIFIFCCWPFSLFAQEKKAVENKLKAVTVYEQKWDKNEAGKVYIESVTRYDQAGNVIEEIEYKEGKIVKHFVYKYDAAGNKIQETEMDAAGKKVKVSTYAYRNKLRTEKTVYDGNNHILSKKTYKYETF